MNTSYRLNVTATVALFFSFNGVAVAQYADGLETDQPLFATDSLMSVRIEAPLATLRREKPEEEYLDGMFYFTDADGQEKSLDLKIRVRGKFRLSKENCNFPPIRLNFRKGQVEGTPFASQDKLKLVSHCQSRRSSYEQLVLREYLAYRIYQTISDKSFGARLMRINYVDTDGKDQPLERYGFVIEDNDNLGERIGLERATVRGIKVEELDLKQANLVSVFMYLIGNTDFSLILGPENDECCHNANLYWAGAVPYTPVPYDFDFSGIVDAPYAEPNPRFRLRSVKSRLYRGRCVNNAILPETFAFYIEKEPEIRALLDNLEELDSGNRKEVTRYLDDFFEDIKDPKTIQRKFVDKCL